MPHDRDHRRPAAETLFAVDQLRNLPFVLNALAEIDLEAELVGHQRDRVFLQALVDRDHDAQLEAFLDHVGNVHPHQVRQVVHGDKLRHAQNAGIALCLFLRTRFLFLAFLPLLLLEHGPAADRRVVHRGKRAADRILDFGLVDFLVPELLLLFLLLVPRRVLGLRHLHFGHIVPDALLLFLLLVLFAFRGGHRFCRCPRRCTLCRTARRRFLRREVHLSLDGQPDLAAPVFFDLQRRSGFRLLLRTRGSFFDRLGGPLHSGSRFHSLLRLLRRRSLDGMFLRHRSRLGGFCCRFFNGRKSILVLRFLDDRSRFGLRGFDVNNFRFGFLDLPYRLGLRNFRLHRGFCRRSRTHCGFLRLFDNLPLRTLLGLTDLLNLALVLLRDILLFLEVNQDIAHHGFVHRRHVALHLMTLLAQEFNQGLVRQIEFSRYLVNLLLFF